jgi:hypothetical protein
MKSETDLLREAFEERTAQVPTSSDALIQIRDRLAWRTRRRRWILAGRLAAVTAVAAGITAMVFVISAVTTPVTAPTPPQPGVSVTATPGPSGPPPAAVAVRVPVYFSGTVDERTGLYREFVATTVPADSVVDRVKAAVRLSLDGAARDPDYGTRWPSGTTIEDVVIDSGVATLDLAGALAAVADDALAWQQLVWTVTAVGADAGQPIEGVVLRLGGTPVSGGLPLVRDPGFEVLAPLWIVSPQEGDTVATTFTVEMAGAVFEATARLRVRDAAGDVVLDEQVMLSEGAPGQGTASTSVALPSGDYTIEAYYVSMRDGSERGLDSHRITVR